MTREVLVSFQRPGDKALVRFACFVSVLLALSIELEFIGLLLDRPGFNS